MSLFISFPTPELQLWTGKLENQPPRPALPRLAVKRWTRSPGLLAEPILNQNVFYSRINLVNGQLPLPKPVFLGQGKGEETGTRFTVVTFAHKKNNCVTVKENHRYSKLTSEFCNRNIIRVCMENLSIVIQGIKIEIKIYQNFLPCLLVLFVVCSKHFCPFPSAILASFSSTVQREQL